MKTERMSFLASKESHINHLAVGVNQHSPNFSSGRKTYN